jgi:hypothetical protein
MAKLISLDLFAKDRWPVWVDPDAMVSVKAVNAERCRILMADGTEYDIAGSAYEVASRINQVR